ncbi:DUF3618 domain-containing protein [Streptomyces sp. CL12-4]|jgi:hypothetical protein|uniref:DUF3618 domain-containing protein n=1 Tax=Streptomyces sp. CL12-4 TaxID=2810306 RepID=UPI001EFA2F1D|nr:DUF3618 domain-containing protein [Streptomyces sp. CL12-4]MCG8971022.1 DUF3618 domain-containing protein [Streptomyces sp. CL12-4]
MTDATSGDGARTGSTAQPTGGAKGPDELRRQIEQTRSQLGDTVEELAGKADVKGRAKARAADLRDKAGAMTVQLRSSAAQAGHSVQDRASRAGHTVHDKADRAGHTAQYKARQRVPERVRGAAQAGMRHPRPVLVAGAAAGAAVAAGVLWRRRHGHC